MNDNITINEEGLMEVSPTASRNATTAFIDQYRQLQGENTAQIGSAAHALGSDLTAQYGGLHGPSEYIKSRYQTPQTESRIAALQTTAQLNALNQLMQNEQEKWKNRYNQAYRNYQKRAYNANKSGSGGGSSSNATRPNYETTDEDLTRVNVGEQQLTLPTTDQSTASWQAEQINAANYGASGNLPTQTGMPVYLERNGVRTAGRLYNSKSGVQGLDTASMSYTGPGAESYIENYIRSGGKLYNSTGKDITSTWRLIY